MGNHQQTPSEQVGDPGTFHGMHATGRRVPIIAFFGTKGGVGKTTIVQHFAALVSRAESRPNVLLVDFDVYHRGLTVLCTRHAPQPCRTVHDYFRDSALTFQGAMPLTSPEDEEYGRLFLIPSADLAATEVYKDLTKTKPQLLAERVKVLLEEAVRRHDAHLVIVDCGPIVDPLTASAAFMSDTAFIIGQNEPITYQSLQNYPGQIQALLPTFNASKVRIILNKVRGNIPPKTAIFAVLPFTLEVVDYAEGIEGIDQIRLTMLDKVIREIIVRVFEREATHLVPGVEAVLSVDQKKAVALIERFPKTNWYRRLELMSLGILVGLAIGALALFGVNQWDFPQWLGLLGLVAGVVFLGLGVSKTLQLYRAHTIVRIKKRSGYRGILDLLMTQKGRKLFSHGVKWGEKTATEMSS